MLFEVVLGGLWLGLAWQDHRDHSVSGWLLALLAVTSVTMGMGSFPIPTSLLTIFTVVLIIKFQNQKWLSMADILGFGCAMATTPMQIWPRLWVISGIVLLAYSWQSRRRDVPVFPALAIGWSHNLW